MDEQKQNNPIEPWDRDSFETGSTKPPKNYGGIVALLLGCIIFMGGIVSAMNMLNIRLIRNSPKEPDQQNPPMIFSEDHTNPSAPPDPFDINLNTPNASSDSFLYRNSLSLGEIYEKNIDSVVSIVCLGADQSSSGTGVVLSSNGYLVTNAHVVQHANSIEVLFSDKQTFSANLVGFDSASDLAVLHVDAKNLKPAEFGDSSLLRVGDSVAAIGDPLGIELRGTLTDGIVSAINRDISVGGRTMTLIQTNAALNAGNSGGPLINSDGQVIGINTMKIGDGMSTAGVEGLGFAIPSSTVKEIAEQLISQGYVSGRPSLGFSGEAVTRLHQFYYGMPAGLYITRVDENSPAEKAGIIPGNILISINGAKITDEDSLIYQLYAYQAGDSVNLVIFQNGKYFSLNLILSEATA